MTNLTYRRDMRGSKFPDSDCPPGTYAAKVVALHVEEDFPFRDWETGGTKPGTAVRIEFSTYVDGAETIIHTYANKLSFNEKSNFMQLVTGILGRDPQDGEDIENAVLDRECWITVESKSRRNGGDYSVVTKAIKPPDAPSGGQPVAPPEKPAKEAEPWDETVEARKKALDAIRQKVKK